MKRILVPVDFSKEAENATQVAVSIAKKSGGCIYLLHMLELPEMTENYTFSGQSEPLFFMDMAKKRFHLFLKLPFLKGIEVHTKILFYKAFDGIKDETKSLNIDLIVMGSKGATGLKEIFIGSNTEKVVRSADVPVLVIKEPLVNFTLNNMVFASNFSSIGRKTFQNVLDFAHFFNAKIHLLYVNTIHNFETSADSLNNINDFIDGFDLNNYTITIYNANSIEQGIINFSKSVKADAIALNTNGRSGLSQLFNGSIGIEITNHAMAPVVTFKL